MPTTDRGPLAETLARLDAADEHCRFVAGEPGGGGWYRLDEVLADARVLDEWYWVILRGLARGRRDVAGSYLASWLGRVVIDTAAIALLAEQRTWPVRATNLALHHHDTGWFDGIAVLAPGIRLLRTDPDADHGHATTFERMDQLRATLIDETVEIAGRLFTEVRARAPIRFAWDVGCTCRRARGRADARRRRNGWRRRSSMARGVGAARRARRAGRGAVRSTSPRTDRMVRRVHAVHGQGHVLPLLQDGRWHARPGAATTTARRAHCATRVGDVNGWPRGWRNTTLRNAWIKRDGEGELSRTSGLGADAQQPFDQGGGTAALGDIEGSEVVPTHPVDVGTSIEQVLGHVAVPAVTGTPERRRSRRPSTVAGPAGSTRRRDREDPVLRPPTSSCARHARAVDVPPATARTPSRPPSVCLRR